MIKFKLVRYGDNAAPAAADAVDGSEAPLSPVNPNGKRVLIVDDDPVFLTATSRKLRSAGFRVATARENSEAIGALDENADIILMDIEFPPDVCNGGMASWDGFQMINWLRRLPTAQQARFIMVSNSGSPENRKRAREMGVAAYFQKPLDHEGLRTAINAEG